MEAEVKVLEGVMEAGLGHIRFAPPATLQALMAEFSVCSVRQSENLTEKKKNIFKPVKNTKIQNKILAAAATASAASSTPSEEEDCESNSSESNYDDTFAVTPASNPNDDSDPMDCTEKGSSDYNMIFKLIFLCFFKFIFSFPGYRSLAEFRIDGDSVTKFGKNQ
jgi:hypothetical protein